MKRCARCGLESLPQSAFCATCGTPFPPVNPFAAAPPPLAKKPWTAGQVVLAIGGILIGIFIVVRFGRELGIEGSGGAGAAPSRPTTAPAPAPSSPEPPALPMAPSPPRDPHARFTSVLTVGTLTFWDKYHANEVAADETFKGKLVELHGPVQGVDKDFLGNVIVKLKSPNQFMSTHAYTRATELAKVARLKRGDDIRIRCIGDGMVMGSPVLRDCVIP